eukprot:gene13446-18030_t
MIPLQISQHIDHAHLNPSKNSPNNSTRHMNSQVSNDTLTKNTDWSIERVISATQQGDYPLVEVVIEQYGVSPNSCDKDGCSLLHWAAINARSDIVNLLIAKKANVNLVGGANGEIPLQWATRNAKSTKITKLLLDEGSNINHKSVHGFDSLFIAICQGQVNITYILLANGADPDTTNSDLESPLQWLITKGQHTANFIELIRLLLSFHASAFTKRPDQNNLLHILSQRDDFDPYLCKLIYENCGGTDLSTAKNADGLRPVD